MSLILVVGIYHCLVDLSPLMYLYEGVQLISAHVFSGPSAAGHLLEDADSRTIFASNVMK